MDSALSLDSQYSYNVIIVQTIALHRRYLFKELEYRIQTNGFWDVRSCRVSFYNFILPFSPEVVLFNHLITFDTYLISDIAK